MPQVQNVTVMFTDMKGFTARTASASRRDLLRLLREHDTVVLPILEARGGQLIKTIGDALMMNFRRPRQALLAAIEVQEALQTRNAELPPKERIEIRIGLHCGEVVDVDGDLFGDVVNTAARIESAAEAGTIYFSQAVLDEAGDLTLPIVPLGERWMKGLPQPVRLFRVGRSGRRGTLEAQWGAIRHGDAVNGGLTALRWTGTVLALAWAALGTLLEVPTLAALGLLGMASLVPYGPRVWRRFQGAWALATVGVGVLGAPYLPSQLQRSLERLAQEAPELRLGQRAAVYSVTGLLWSAQALVGSPVARARLQMLQPFEPQPHHTDAAMASRTVRRHLARFAQRLRHPEDVRAVMRPVEVPLSLPDRPLPTARLELQATATRLTDRWRLEVVARGPVTTEGSVALVPDQIELDPRLVQMLEEAGWLRPYLGTWRWVVTSDDPRLKDALAGGLARH